MVERATTSSSSVLTNQPRQVYVEGERLKCCGGKYKGSIVKFIKQLRVKVRVQFDDGEMRDLMPTSVQAYIPPVPKRLKTSVLIAMVEVSLSMQGLDTLDREMFLVLCEDIGRRAFA
jgi:predicted ATP-dependent Lon-type protease